MSTPEKRDTSPKERRSNRQHRSRTTPKWLLEQGALDSVAQRRCLMVLSVLSGEKPVTDAIREAEISRGMYYQLESRALSAMLRAMLPGAEADGTPPPDGSAARAVELEEKVKRLEQDKRRAERLLFLTRKVVKPGVLKLGPGRPPRAKAKRSSKSPGGSASKASTPTTASSQPAPTSSPAPSPETTR